MRNQSLKSKIFVLTLAFVMVFTGLGISSWGVGEAWADTAEITVFVSVSSGGTVVNDKEGNPMALEAVTLTGKESYTMGDALSRAHELYYEGGAEAGYASETGTYGESLTKLWGNDSGNFGYQLRQGAAYVSVTGLAQEISDGDIIDAYVNKSTYPDNEAHSYFDTANLTVSTGESFDLTLKTVTGYDSSWNSVYDACEAAVITIDGTETQYETDSNGMVSLKFDSAGTYLISAVKTKTVGEDTVTSITAPLCKVQAVEPIDVTVSAQRTCAFNYMPNTVSVAYGTAAKYGFSNGFVPEGTITALDALVAAHVQKYGEAFTKETASTYLTTNGTSPVKMFGNDATSTDYSGFAVNHSYYMDEKGNGYMANTAPLKSGDLLDFFYYEDEYWGDTVAWFEEASGKKLDTLNVETGEDIELYLKGFMFMSGYSSPEPEPIYNEDELLSVYIVDEEGNPEGDAPLATVTEDTGAVKLNFDQTGTYYITAMGYESNEFLVTMPWLKVTANEAGSITDNTASAITISGITYDFKKDTYDYTLPQQLYSKGSLSFKVTAGDAKEIKASVNGGAEVSLTSDKAKNLNIAAGKNTIKISIVPKDNSNALTKSYIYNVSRDVSAKTISLTTEGNNVKLDKTFSPTEYTYTANMLAGATAVFAVTTQGDTANSKVTVNGEAVKAGYTISAGSNVFTVKIGSKDGTVEKTYTITITGVSSVSNSITVPEGAVLKVWDPSGNLLKNGEGNTEAGKTTYTLSNLLTGEKYTLQVSKYGFSTKGSEFTASSDDSDNLDVALNAVSEPTSSVTAEWENFRNSDDNMAVISMELPKTSEETALKWMQSGASVTFSPGTQIIVNDKIVFTSGNKISLINKTTGAVEKTTTMTATKGYGYMPATYGGGMIYVALSNGIIQAFDAVTLESKWIYKDNLGGQALSNISYNDGYIYTGFWVNATSPANYVCISAADENTEASDEEKYATWTYSHTGGFYWSGAYISEDKVVVGADNKTLLLLNKKTGEALDTKTVDGDIRCSIAYSEGNLYFVTKAGSLYSASLSGDKITDLAVKASIGGESSSTPVIVNGYAYVGVKNNTIAQVKLADGTVKTVETKAYSQSSLLANTAESSKTYLYFTYNKTPGGVQVIEVDNATGEMSLSDLYTPAAAQQQYCVSSVICDADGTLYYYNDSGNLFALEKQAVSEAKRDVTFTVKNSAGATITDATCTLVRTNNESNEYSPVNGIYSLPEGNYTYTIAKTGYQTVSGTLTVGTENMTIPVTLRTGNEGTTTPSVDTVSITVKGHNNTANYPLSTFNWTEGMTPISLLQLVTSNINWVSTQYGAYVAGIDGLSEFDYGSGSGWLYTVNGVSPSFSAGNYALKKGDTVVWTYTTNLGEDVGLNTSGSAVQQNEVTTSTVSGTVITTVPTQVTVTGEKATATVSDKNTAEMLKQAQQNNSEKIVVVISQTDLGSANTAELSLPTDSIREILSKTDAVLVVKTGDKETVYDREALKALSEAEGKMVVLEVNSGEANKANNDKIISGIEKTRIVLLKGNNSKFGRIKLTWKKSNSGFRLDQYQIWRSQKKSSGYKKMFTTKNKYYINTKDVVSGRTYWYKVRGVRSVDGKNVYTPFTKIKITAK